MTRDIYDIAKEIAGEIVSTAHCAGYTAKPDRVLFFRSDIGRLEGDIADWLESHMRVDPGYDAALPSLDDVRGILKP